MVEDKEAFLTGLYPYSALSAACLQEVLQNVAHQQFEQGETLYSFGAPMPGLFIIRNGEIDVSDSEGQLISTLGPGNSFGERGLLADGRAVTTARAAQPSTVLVLGVGAFHKICSSEPAFKRFFERGDNRKTPDRPKTLATTQLAEIMTPEPAIMPGSARIDDVASEMRDRRISSVLIVEDGVLLGIVTARDMATKVVAQGVASDSAIASVMSRSPFTLPANALGSDVLHAMAERRISHIPVLEAGKVLGIVTQTDLTRHLADNSATLVRGVVKAQSVDQIAEVTARIPNLLVNLVGSGHRHDVVTRLITDIADAATRRLLAMAEAELGPPPVPYVWAACGSQGRREQTGVSDQDNCLILSDEARAEHDAYFSALAEFVCDGLHEAGYVHCPGEMMATSQRWRQPLKLWQGYFQKWIAKPDPEAQMLASVMFDLRAISGDEALLEGLQADTLQAASQNSIFVAHMISNALKHTPPLSMFRGIATMRRDGGQQRAVDLKHSGVVPITDIGRVYSLRKADRVVNSRERIEAAMESGAVSTKGGRDLLDAYDMIAEARLAHQTRQIRNGDAPDNFLVPTELSDFERSHLRDAFVVVRSMQSALSQSAGGLM